MLEQFPVELIFHIIKFLTLIEICNLRKINKLFCEISRDSALLKEKLMLIYPCITSTKLNNELNASVKYVCTLRKIREFVCKNLIEDRCLYSKFELEWGNIVPFKTYGIADTLSRKVVCFSHGNLETNTYSIKTKNGMFASPAQSRKDIDIFIKLGKFLGNYIIKMQDFDIIQDKNSGLAYIIEKKIYFGKIYYSVFILVKLHCFL